MTTRLIILAILLALCSTARAQPLIGMPKDQVEDIIKEKHREFRKDQTVVKQQFNYLKYVNGQKTKTWIAYFSEEDTCTGTKLVCDYSEYNEVLKDLNNSFRKTGKQEWEYTRGTDTFRVKLTKEEWYFIVREKKWSIKEEPQNAGQGRK